METHDCGRWIVILSVHSFRAVEQGTSNCGLSIYQTRDLGLVRMIPNNVLWVRDFAKVPQAHHELPELIL